MKYTVIEKWSGGHYRAVLYPSIIPKGGRRGVRENPTTEFRQRLNDTTQMRKLIATLEVNFSLDDLFITLTYDDNHLPPNFDAAAKCLQGFIKKYRTVRKREGFASPYIYITEGYHGDHRMHHHIVTTSSGNTAKLIKELWTFGYSYYETIRSFAHNSADRYPTISLANCIAECGMDRMMGAALFNCLCYEKLARYLTKEPRKTGRNRPGDRAYTPSLRLRKPEIKKYEIENTRVIDVPEGVIVLNRASRDGPFGAISFVDGMLKTEYLDRLLT